MSDELIDSEALDAEKGWEFYGDKKHDGLPEYRNWCCNMQLYVAVRCEEGSPAKVWIDTFQKSRSVMPQISTMQQLRSLVAALKGEPLVNGEHPLVVASREGRRDFDLKISLRIVEAQARYWYWGYMSCRAFSREKPSLFRWCSRRANRYEWSIIK